MTKWRDIDQFMRVNSRGRTRGEIADVVRARAARVEANALDPPQNLRCVFRLDRAHLDIRACGDLDVAAGERVGNFRELAQLKGLQLPGGDAEPAHEGVFDRREEKQAVPFEAKDIL